MLISRQSKGSMLTHEEVDGNFAFLLNEIQNVAGIASNADTKASETQTSLANKADLSAENTFDATQTFDKAIFQKNLPNAGTTLDLKETSHFKKTITANTTFAVSNVPAAGYTASFLLELTNGGAYTVNWWAGMKWASGTPPVLTASGRDVLGFFTSDGGATWTGVQIVKDAK